MATLLFTHPSSHRHSTPRGHPERIARIEAVERALAAPEFAALDRRLAPEVAREDLERAHDPDYIDEIAAVIPAEGHVPLDPDTFVSPGSLEAALHAAGAVTAAVDAVLAGEGPRAFCAIRPPGHHAERRRAMGFCLFSNAAIGVLRALDHHGLERVAVVDFDVHHGNGTQDILWDEARAFFASSHQMPLYPGTGAPTETGAHGNVLNMPFPPGTDGATWCAHLEVELLPALDSFAPQLIVISAGFDAHRSDPLAQMALIEDDFAWITRQVCQIADRHAGGKVVSTLEGGYDLDALAASVAAHVRALMEGAD